MLFDNSINLLSREELIKEYIDDFNTSIERILMFTGEQYYTVNNDILTRKLYRYENNIPVVDIDKTNNKLAHGFMKILVDDKVNYLLTKPYTLTCRDDEYMKRVTDTLGKRFRKTLSRLGVQASNKGIGWLHPYINSSGEFKTMIVPSERVIALWSDNEREELEAIIYYEDQEYYEGKTKKTRTIIEYWTKENVDYYVMENNQVILNAEEYFEEDHLGHFKVNGKDESWQRVPFIPFRNNDMELPDIQFVKTLIDNYDLTRSDVANLLEDIKNIIMVLKGYDGEKLSDFMRDLNYYKAVKVDRDGGVDSIANTIDIQAAKEHYERLFKDINTFGQGVDKDPNTIGNAPSGVALSFLYSGLDLKCNDLEEWFKYGFEELLYFVNMYLNLTKQGDSKENIEIVFNRDIMVNESAAIADVKNSVGILSDYTVRSNHPWVRDIDEEEDRIAKESSREEQKGIPYKEQEGDLGGKE